MANHPNRNRKSAGYVVHSADWRTGRVTVQRPDGSEIRIGIGELKSASYQSDADLRKTYTDIHQRALREVEAARRESVRACPEHRAIKAEDFGFTGPVRSDENRAAHGNICQVETCACGGQRRTNINQHHREVGEWK